MRVVSYRKIEAKEVEGSYKLKIRWLNTEGSNNFAARHCEIEPDGYSPNRKHPWEHETFIIEGTVPYLEIKNNTNWHWRFYFYSKQRNSSDKEYWQEDAENPLFHS